MFAGAIFSISIVLLGLSAASNGDVLNVTISADPPLHSLICVDKSIVFTCKVTNVAEGASIQYQWSIGDGKPTIGDNTFSMLVSSLSTITVTCEAYVRGVSTQYGKDTVTIKPTGIIPQINFQYVTHNFVYELTRRPFNLTATVVSNFNLTSLHWSPPETSGPLSSKTITVRHGNMTTTTFMLLENATLGDSGNYTLTAVNECGKNSSQIDVEVLNDCPLPKFTAVQPMPNFTAVEGYNATMKCSYDGYYSPSSPLRVWALFPHSLKPQYIDNSPYYDCKCWMEDKAACPIGTDPNDCCRFELIMHSTPVLKDNGTAFSCIKNFTKDIAWMFVVPSPKVLEPPRNHNATVGSTAVFTCDFEASTDSKIAQIHWEFNGSDLAGCRRFQDRINCTVTQNSTDTNYISSTLEIYSVQADNAGQYTCYCSYDTSVLNVDGVQVIQSDRKSATLSVQSGSSHTNTLLIIIGVSVGAVVILIIIIVIIFTGVISFRRGYVRRKRHQHYQKLPGRDEPLREITNEMLDQYIKEELFIYWEKLGKALHLEDQFLEDIFDRFPEDPAERLRVILTEWRDTTEHPSLDTLDGILKKLGLQPLIPDRSTVVNLQLRDHVVPTDRQTPVGGPGPLVGINRESRILPGVNNHPIEIKAFQGVLRCGLPPLTVLTVDLQEEWKELGKHMGLQSSDLEQIKQQHSSKTIECCWAVCVHWLNRNPEATWGDLLEKLNSVSLQWNTIASGLYHYLKSLQADTDSGPKHKKKLCAVLRKHYKEIVSHVNPEELLVQLVTHNLVTEDEHYMLMNQTFSPQKRNQLLIIALFSKDPNTSVQSFYECLKAEKHHTGHQYLADLLGPDIREFENQHQAANNRGPSDSNAAATTTTVAAAAAAAAAATTTTATTTTATAAAAAMTESEIDRLLPTLKSYWLQVAETLSAPQEMVNNATSSSQDPEEQARMFLQLYAMYSRKENIYRALDELGIMI